MRYRRPGILDRMPAQAVPFKPQSAYRAPFNPFMPNDFSAVPGVQPLPGFQATPSAPPAATNPAAKKTYKTPAPKPVQGAATRTPTPAPAPTAAAPGAQNLGGLMSMFGNVGAMDPEQMKEMRERFQRLSDASISRQRNLLDKMSQRYESTLKNKKGLLDIDWTPTLALIDMINRPFTPSNFAATYQQSSLRPESEPQRQNRLSQMEGQMLAGERGILNAEIQGMNAMNAAGFGGGAGLRLLRQMMRDQNIDERMVKREEFKDRRYSLKEGGEFITDVMDDVFKDKRDIENVTSGLKDRSLMRVQSVLSSLSRMMGERGVLTEGDIGRQLYQSLQLYVAPGGKIEQWFSANPNKPLPDDIVKPLEQTINAAMDASRNSFKGKLESQLDMMNQNPIYKNYMGDIKPMFQTQINRINGIYSGKVSETKKSELEQLKEELKKLEGK